MENNYQMLPYEPEMLEACVRLYQDVFPGRPGLKKATAPAIRGKASAHFL